jgi:hypothetical protein
MSGVARAATITPTTTIDTQPPTVDGSCSLREAVLSMNQHSDFPDCTHTGTYGTNDTIELGPNFYGLAGTGDDFNSTGDLDTYDPMTIEGTGPAQSGIIATADRAIDAHGPLSLVGLSVGGSHVTGNGGGVQAGPGLTLTNVTVNGNSATQAGGGIYDMAGGVTLIDSTVSNNTASTDGGGIDGGVTITNSTVSGNHAPAGHGGGVSGSFTVTGSTVSGNNAASGGGLYGNGRTITDSTVANNTSNGNDGGGVYDTGSITISGTTIAGNQATGTYRQGGGIYVGGPSSILNLTNSTLSGNSATGYGGGLSSATSSNATVNLQNDTINRNTANSDADTTGHGGGIDQAPSVTVHLKNTIVAGNTDMSATGKQPDCNGNASGVIRHVISQGYNLFGTTTGCSVSLSSGDQDLGGVDPQIAPLADNGGPTQTSALLLGSPAIDAGNPLPPGSGGDACAAADQRGVSRPQGTSCDIGAFEFPYRTLAVSLAGTGSGTVSGPGLSCDASGAGCSRGYPAGTSVTLGATPTHGSSFDGFGGDCTGIGGCELTMSANRNVTATFTGPPDTTPPKQTLRGRRRQRIGKLSVTDSVSEPSHLGARATVSLPAVQKRVVRSRAVTANAFPGHPAKLRFKFSRRKLRPLKRALAQGRHLKAKVRVAATDAAGNQGTATKRVRLKR